jgi:hypothetical protein
LKKTLKRKKILEKNLKKTRHEKRERTQGKKGRNCTLLASVLPAPDSPLIMIQLSQKILEKRKEAEQKKVWSSKKMKKG